MTHLISKTSFLKFEQCPKAFFFYKNLPYLKDKVTIDKELTFKRGHDVGYYAQQLFPGGVDVSSAESRDEMLSLTKTLIQQQEPVIYEATFCFNEVLVMVDILCLEKDGYTAYEVKSSLKVSEVHLHDACLQHYVLSQTLAGFKELYLVTLNPNFVKSGLVKPKDLFKKRSVSRQAIENFSYFEFQIQAAKQVLEKGSIPNIPVGPQCFRPYQCDFFGVCWKENLSEGSVFHLPMTSKETQFLWHNAGLRLIEQVPDEMLEKQSLLRIKNAFVLNKPFVDLEAIGRFLGSIRYPAAAMDMEVWSPAIPEIEGTRPFEQVPFLVSFFDGQKPSYHFSPHLEDEREDFAKALIRLSEPYQTLLVYDKGLELAVIRNLRERFPHLASSLDRVSKKLVDVFDVFLHLQYYDPGFRNSFSLKTVSAVLLPDLKYSEIGSGLEAMGYYAQYRLQDNPFLKQELADKLVAYCNTDAVATFGVVEFLRTHCRVQ